MKRSGNSKILLCAFALFCIVAFALASGAQLVSVSEDGALVLKTISNNQGLILADTKSGKEIVVSNGIGAGTYASISPDNLYVCFKLIEIGRDGNRIQTPMLFDIENSILIPLANPSKVAGTPAVSPDGKIAYTVGNILYVLDPDLNTIMTADLGHHVNLIAFSPDGQSIAYNNPEEQIVVISLNGDTKLVTNGEGAFWDPEFSPDGDKLLASTVDGRIFCIDQATGALQIVGKGSDPGWEDNDTIAFVKKTIKKQKVSKTEIVSVDSSGKTQGQILLNTGDAQAVINKGEIASSNAGVIKRGKIGRGNAVWLDEISGKGGESPDGGMAIQGVETNGNIVECVGVPYCHQVYDTPNWFNGHWACGASSAIMAIQYYNILPDNPITIDVPYSHTHDFGFYVPEIYSYNGYTYNIAEDDPNGTPSYGGYGFITQNNWEDTKGHMAEYFNQHGLSSLVDWSPTFAKAQQEVNADDPFVLLNSLTSGGHYITTIGYYTDQYTLVFNDPYGNKNTSGYPSYDGTRVFYDWPGYNYGYENLNTVHCYIYARYQSGPTPTPTPTPTPGTDVVVDNDYGSPWYTETGAWSTSASSGYNGGSYRFCYGGDNSTATWTGALSESGAYDCYAMYRQSTNRVTSAKFIIHASDGDHNVYTNQNGDNTLVTTYLGVFSFNAGDNSITLDALGSTPSGSAVISDAVRFTLTGPTPTPTPSPTPTPTPTPTPEPGDVYVNDIAMSYKAAGPNISGLAIVWIKNDSDEDVEGATVYGDWTGCVTGSSQGVTEGDGKVTLESPKKNGGGTYNFCVTDVVAAGYIYNEAMNVETCDSITEPPAGPTPTPTPTPTSTPTETPTPTPTPTPTGTPSGKVYVNDIAMSYKAAGPNINAIATVWIKNDSGGDVEDATVYGEWTGVVTGSSEGTTGSDGKVELTSPKKNGGGTFNFCVTDVVASGYTYDEGMNVETCDSITYP